MIDDVSLDHFDLARDILMTFLSDPSVVADLKSLSDCAAQSDYQRGLVQTSYDISNEFMKRHPASANLFEDNE
jgi:hypothetical protein